MKDKLGKLPKKPKKIILPHIFFYLTTYCGFTDTDENSRKYVHVTTPCKRTMPNTLGSNLSSANTIDKLQPAFEHKKWVNRQQLDLSIERNHEQYLKIIIMNVSCPIKSILSHRMVGSNAIRKPNSCNTKNSCLLIRSVWYDFALKSH